jgi:DNA gyrase subunit B
MLEKREYRIEDVRTVTLNEAIRLRPGMYVGSVKEKGFTDLLRRIMSDATMNNRIDIFFLELKENLEGKLTFNNQNGALENSWVGLKKPFVITDFYVLNALSEKFKISFWDIHNKKITEQYFEKGNLINGDVIEKIDCSKVEIDFTLDKDIWKMDFQRNNTYIIHQLREFAYLNKKTKFQINYKEGTEACKVIYHFRNGLRDRINLELLNGLGESYFEAEIDTQIKDFHIELAFAFREYTVDYPYLKSYVNNFYMSENGTHVDGLLKGLTYGIMKYLQKHDLVNKYKISKKGIKENLVAAINIKMDVPFYGGCVKNKIINSEIIEPIANYVAELFFQKIEQNEEATKQLLTKFEI